VADAGSEKAVSKDILSRQSVAGFHPSMATILGDISSFEITRFYGGALPPRKPGTMLEVNLLAGSMTERRLLKVPRCPACSPLNDLSPTSLKLLMNGEGVLR
jgi:hypothetical protein